MFILIIDLSVGYSPDHSKPKDIQFTKLKNKQTKKRINYSITTVLSTSVKIAAD